MIVRHKVTSNFTVMHNDMLRNVALSFKARGILAMLLTYPDNWSVSERWLAEQSSDGVAAVRSGLKELEETGYLVRNKTRSEDGKYVWESTIFDYPCLENRCVDKCSNRSTVGRSTNTTTSATQEELPFSDIAESNPKDILIFMDEDNGTFSPVHTGVEEVRGASQQLTMRTEHLTPDSPGVITIDDDAPVPAGYVAFASGVVQGPLFGPMAGTNKVVRYCMKQPEPAQPQPSVTPATIVTAYLDALEKLGRVVDRKNFARHIRVGKRIQQAGYSPEEVALCVANMGSVYFWKDKPITLEKVSDTLMVKPPTGR